MTTPSSHTTRNLAKRGRRRLLAFALATFAPLTAIGVADSVLAASYTIVNTGGLGVKQRNNPTIASSYNGVAPEGATFNVECQTWSEPVGSFANRLWLKVNRAGVNFSWYIADTYTNSPRKAIDPALAGIPMCGTTAPEPPPPPSVSFPSLQMPFACNSTWTATTYDRGELLSGSTVVRSWSHANYLDFGQAGAAGQPVLASAAGFARLTNSTEGQVTVDHGNGWSTEYQHMTGITVDSSGRQVSQRDPLGVIGAGQVGTSTGSHLHYAQLVNGAAQTPAFATGSYTWTAGTTSTSGNYRFYNDRSSTNSLRSGNCATAITPDVSQYAGHIVQWDADTNAQKTAWLVMPDLTRVWIPDSATYFALKALGAPGPTVLTATQLDILRDRTGQRAYADQLGAGWQVGRGAQIWSTANGYALIFQGDGNLVLYAPGGRAIWATYQFSATRMVMQADGNLVLYNGSNVAVWASGTAGHGRSRLVMQADGNLVIYRGDGRATWATMTNGGTNRLNNSAGTRL